MKKRILSILICLLLILSLVPASAFAVVDDYKGTEEWTVVNTWAELTKTLSDSQTQFIRVGKNISASVNTTYPVRGADKVLDLNGKSIKAQWVGTKDGKALFDLTGGLTIIDTQSGGKIRFTARDDYGYEVVMSGTCYDEVKEVKIFDVSVGGKLHLVSGNLDAGSDNYQYVIYLKKETNGDRYDGKVHQVVWGTVADVEQGGSLIVSGGTLTGRGETMTGSAHTIYKNAVIKVRNGGKAVINDGYFLADEGSNVFDLHAGSLVTVNGGKFELSKGNRVRIPDNRNDSQIVGGRYFDGTYGTVNLPRTALSSRAVVNETIEAGKTKDANTVLYNAVIKPAMMAVYPDFTSTSTNTMDYALGRYEILTLDTNGYPVFYWDKDALKWGIREVYDRFVDWTVTDNTTGEKTTYSTPEETVNLAVLCEYAGCKVGHSYTISPRIRENWRSYSSHDVVSNATTKLTINIKETLTGTYGWETRPVVGQKAVVTSNLNVPAGTKLTYSWKVSENNTWKEVASTKVPEYTFGSSYYNRMVLCDIYAEGYGSYVRVAPYQVKYPANTGEVKRCSYTLSDPDYKTITLTNTAADQDYVLSDQFYTGNIDYLWKQGVKGSSIKFTESYSNTGSKGSALVQNKTYYLYTRKSASTGKEAGTQVETIVIFNGAGNPKGVQLENGSNVVYMKEGTKKTFTLTYEPSNANTASVGLQSSGGYTTSYSMPDKTHLTVEALKAGVDYITFYISGYPPQQFAQATVYVYKDQMKPANAYVTESLVEMTVGERYTNGLTFTPEGYSAKGTWKILSGEGVVSVDAASGKVTALKAGNALVGYTFESIYGESSTNYSITVVDPEAVETHVHDFKTVGSPRPATCTTPAEQDYKCACGVEMTVSGEEPLQHQAAAGYGYDETHHWNTCDLCGAHMNEEAHKGEEEVCTVCGYNAGHVCTLEKVAAEDSTCLEPGHEEYYICTECGRPYSDAEGKKPLTDMENLLKERKPHSLDEEGVCVLCKTRPGAQLTTPFTDVPKEAYYYDATAWAFNSKPQITDGNGKDKFMPEQICTRGQVVTFLWRALGEPEPKNSNNPFTDVKTSDYFYKPVLWAVENGITDGTAPDKFSPATPCKNSHILTFVWRALGEPDKTGTGTWYTDAQNWAVKNGLLDGTYEGAYDVNAQCPRKNVVEYLYRYYNMK